MTLTAGDEGRLRSSYGTPLSPLRPSTQISRVRRAIARPSTGEDQTFENPKTGAVLETAFVYPDGTKGTDLYLSVTSRDTVPPNPYRR